MSKPFSTFTLVVSSTCLGFTMSSLLYDRDLYAYVCLAVAAALFLLVVSRYRADRQSSIAYDPSVGILTGLTQKDAEALRSFFTDIMARQIAALMPPTGGVDPTIYAWDDSTSDLLDYLDPDLHEHEVAELLIDRESPKPTLTCWSP